MHRTIHTSRGTLPIHLGTTVHELGLWLNATTFTVYGREPSQPDCYAPPDTPLAEVTNLFADLELEPRSIKLRTEQDVTCAEFV